MADDRRVTRGGPAEVLGSLGELGVWPRKLN
jgi:hypothetical protein